MSAQFGMVNFDGKPVDPKDLEELRPVLAPYGPDGEGYICEDNLGILYRAFHSTKESRREVQPHISPSGCVITWDGRLDCRMELTLEIGGELSNSSTDIEIVAKAYERWGTDAFGKIIGDWALSIWDPQNQSLILAKDFVGTRHLYYTGEPGRIRWCTILDPLVLSAGRVFQLEEEYIAGWLAMFPETHLTPYVGIHSVPPSSFVRLTKGLQSISKYWDFDPDNRICYRTDKEYEEHFRSAFSEAVRRRLRSDAPVLAELSGGMDSSSIVCVADRLLRQQVTETSRLDTVSYYDDSEPNWNERPYFSKVEQMRAQIGCHINLCREPSGVNSEHDKLPLSPGKGESPSPSFADYVVSHGNRVVVSGLGGDEVTGGIPSPAPELQDLIVQAKLRALVGRLTLWALSARRPWLHLLFEAAGEFFPRKILGTPKDIRPPLWLTERFRKRNPVALCGYQKRLSFYGPLPTLQQNLGTLDAMRRQLGCEDAFPTPVVEMRYPFLDRSFLEFVFAIPREQLVRPGQRRSLLRRSLAGLVPDEILNRRRKAFVSRGPRVAIAENWPRYRELSQRMICSTWGIVEPKGFLEALQRARAGQEVQMVTLMRTLLLEAWMIKIDQYNVFDKRLAPASHASTSRHDRESKQRVAGTEFS